MDTNTKVKTKTRRPSDDEDEEDAFSSCWDETEQKPQTVLILDLLSKCALRLSTPDLTSRACNWRQLLPVSSAVNGSSAAAAAAQRLRAALIRQQRCRTVFVQRTRPRLSN